MRRKTLVCATGLSMKSYRNAIKDGCMLRTEPRRRIVYHAVNSDTASAIIDTTGEIVSIFYLRANMAITERRASGTR